MTDNLVQLSYIVAAALFIFSLKWMNSPVTARRGVAAGELGMALAIATRAAIPLTLYALFLLGALTTTSPLLHFIGSPMVLEFLLGVLVARLPRHPALGTLIPIGLALVAMTSPGMGDVESSLGPQWALARALQWGVPAALIVWGTLSLERMLQGRAFNLPVAVGDASYAIYLFHPLAAFGLAFAWPIRLAAALGIGSAMHVLVERRLVQFRSRWRGFADGVCLRGAVVKAV
jgi:exopolysaccharide production protein ExoZ